MRLQLGYFKCTPLATGWRVRKCDFCIRKKAEKRDGDCFIRKPYIQFGLLSPRYRLCYNSRFRFPGERQDVAKSNSLGVPNNSIRPPALPVDTSLFCPRCSTKLMARLCKLICNNCGYYMSCSDFY